MSITDFTPTEDTFQEWLEDNPGSTWDDYIRDLEDAYVDAMEQKADMMREEKWLEDDQ